MMKKIILYCLATVLFFGCKKEEDLTPSGLDLNWFILQDSQNPIDHHLYQIFEKYRLPIFYNDTIGSTDRIDNQGAKMKYYERLQVFYFPGNSKPTNSTHNYTKIIKEDISKIDPVITFLEKEVIPVFHNKFFVQSLFLVTDLVSPSGDNAFKGLNTLTIGKALLFNTMTDAEKKSFKGAIIGVLTSGDIISKNTEWLETNFYNLTYKVNPARNKQDFYSGVFTYSLMRLYDDMAYIPPLMEMKLGDFGFITALKKSTIEGIATVPTKNLDVSSYIEALFAYTTEEIEEKYGQFPVVMGKFDVMRTLLKQYKFEF